MGYRSREKIIRRPNGYGYPGQVCLRCGEDAAKKSNTYVEPNMSLRIDTCDICHSLLVEVGDIREFGFPTFYTYANGMPVE